MASTENHLYPIFLNKISTGEIKLPRYGENYISSSFKAVLVTESYEYNDRDTSYTQVKDYELIDRNDASNTSVITRYLRGGSPVYFFPLRNNSSSDKNYYALTSTSPNKDSSVSSISALQWKNISGAIKHIIIYCDNEEKTLVACFTLDDPQVLNNKEFSIYWGTSSAITISNTVFKPSESKNISNVSFHVGVPTDEDGNVIEGKEDYSIVSVKVDYADNSEQNYFNLFTISNSIEDLETEFDTENPVILSKKVVSDLSKDLHTQIVNSNYKLGLSMTTAGKGRLTIDIVNMSADTTKQFYLKVKHLPNETKVFNNSTLVWEYLDKEEWIEDSHLSFNNIEAGPSGKEITYSYDNARCFDVALYSLDDKLLAQQFVSYGEANKSYSINITSSNGNVVRLRDYSNQDDVMVTLTCHVYEDGVEITDKLKNKIYAEKDKEYVVGSTYNRVNVLENEDITGRGLLIKKVTMIGRSTSYTYEEAKPNAFIWTRTSSSENSQLDTIWNTQAFENNRSFELPIRKKDIVKKTSFFCTVIVG